MTRSGNGGKILISEQEIISLAQTYLYARDIVYLSHSVPEKLSVARI